MSNRDTEALVKKFEEDVKEYHGFVRFLLALDQLFNVILWNGSMDETISSHIGRRIENNKATWFDKLICKGLRVIQSKHCILSRGE